MMSLSRILILILILKFDLVMCIHRSDDVSVKDSLKSKIGTEKTRHLPLG